MQRNTARILLLLGAAFTAPGWLLAQESTPAAASPLAQMPRTLRWGLQRPDLMRYNRVEGLSMGVRGQIRPHTVLGPVSVTATARLGIADLEPNVRIDLTREAVERRVTFGVFHELAAIEKNARHLGIGNSLLAAFSGRDDGDYYRRSGVSFEWTPPDFERQDLKF